MNKVIVKLGGSIITKKKEGLREVNQEILAQLSGEIKQALEEIDIKLVVVHGAGPYGHVPADKYRLDEGYNSKDQLDGFVETRKSMEELNKIVVDSLINKGVNAVAFQPSASGILEDGRLVGLSVETVEALLGLGFVPVGYGDVLMDRKTGFKILSGDQLAAYLAIKLKAGLVVMVGDYDGVFEGNPGESDKIPIVNRENIKSLKSKGNEAIDVTGGFGGKLLELMELAEKGVDTRIISGCEKNNLRDTLLGGRECGTLVTY